jgi:transcriptional regulator with XRE-family HTH domain
MKDDSAERLLGRLKALRIARGLTQEEFAEKSGFSYKYYQALEAGRKRNMRLETLDRLAKAHGLESWQLLLPAEAADPKAKQGRVRSGRAKTH